MPAGGEWVLSDERGTRASPGAGSESAAEALARARDHARSAASEAIAALRALLDAAALGVSAETAEHHHMFAALAGALDDLSERFSAGNTDVSSLILDALNAEIERWEGRSRSDSDSRAVLRAFLGMREILWEFGIRSNAPSPNGAGPDEPKDPTPPRRKPPRVQRVEVQG